MLLKFGSKVWFGYDPEKTGEIQSESFEGFIKGLMSFPLNIPGAAFHKCLQEQKKILKLIRDTIEEKRASPESRRGDLLDRLIDEMKSDNLSTENLISYVIFVLLFATSGRSPQLQVWPSSYWQSMLLLCKN
ncbi:hypothetical protein H0E87_004284 [Populus deltoides]|uniref:Cytochrome P450 n=1 Tax=Populus deltoides TaxID=3696 RepID=A0A8T2ZEK5_POPDE|nr:hypothetical protein H0E87_004284 [Populus deltoides]